MVCFLWGGGEYVFGSDKKMLKKKPKVIALNSEQVAKCVKLLPAFMKEFPAFNPLTNTNARPGKNKQNIAALVTGTKKQKLDAFCQKNGYKDFNDFARSFTGVMSAYMYYKSKEAIKMVKDHANNLPPETASLMKVQLKPLIDNMQKLKDTVSPELLVSVKTHLPALDEVMGLQQ